MGKGWFVCVTQVVIQDTVKELLTRRNSYTNRRDVGEVRLHLHFRIYIFFISGY